MCVGAIDTEIVDTPGFRGESFHFSQEVFPAEYGALYDSDLQTLFWEFLCRLAQLLPVPDLTQVRGDAYNDTAVCESAVCPVPEVFMCLSQTASWLGAERSVLEDCVQSVSEPTHLNHLLQHHRHLGHLEQHGESFL